MLNTPLSLVFSQENLHHIIQIFVPTGDSTADEVARCLNALTLRNMRNIASEGVLNELMNDYFFTWSIDDSQTLVEKILM